MTAQTTTAADQADAAQTITALRKRLSHWEREHLRSHAADLAERLDAANARIEALESEVWRAWEAADAWRDQSLQLVADLQQAGETIGLTVGGALVVVGGQDVQGGAA